MKYEITYKDNTQKEHKGKYLYIDQVNKLLLIDNIIVAKLEDLYQVKFLVNGYYQVINI